jgi:hypothetical protein
MFTPAGEHKKTAPKKGGLKKVNQKILSDSQHRAIYVAIARISIRLLVIVNGSTTS